MALACGSAFFLPHGLLELLDSGELLRRCALDDLVFDGGVELLHESIVARALQPKICARESQRQIALFQILTRPFADVPELLWDVFSGMEKNVFSYRTKLGDIAIVLRALLRINRHTCLLRRIAHSLRHAVIERVARLHELGG